MKLLVPHLIILALLAAGAIVSFVSVTNIRKQAERFYDGSFAVKNTAQTMNETLEAMQASLYRAISNDAQDITGEAISEAEIKGRFFRNSSPGSSRTLRGIWRPLQNWKMICLN